MPYAEKLEDCPRCGEVKRWLYDAQICASCGHGDLWAASRARSKPSALSEAQVAALKDLRDRQSALWSIHLSDAELDACFDEGLVNTDGGITPKGRALLAQHGW